VEFVRVQSARSSFGRNSKATPNLMGHKNMIRVLTWNVGQRRPSLVAAVDSVHADIVTLQEIRVDRAPAFQQHLFGLGLKYSYFSGSRRARTKRYGNIIASRVPLKAMPVPTGEPLPWPQLLAHGSVFLDGHEIRLVTAHIPNGISNGWAKIDTFRALASVVRNARGCACIVTGDFNEPRSSLQDQRIVTFGQEPDDNGRFACWDKWSFQGRSGTGQEWDAAVRWFFENRKKHGLRNAYWEAHGNEAIAVSHVSRGEPRWFDHIFVSDHFHVVSCEYLHQFRGPGISDHSGLLATLALASS
jgi:endonuclease/exonuclease/phosphatase family metal-dependent hydrolase